MNTQNAIIFICLMIFLTACNLFDLEQGEMVQNQQNIKVPANAVRLAKIETSVFKTESGWGYEIIIDNKIYIHQSYMPAINGTRSFASREDADKVAKYVAARMQKELKLPSLTYAELDSLNVL